MSTITRLRPCSFLSQAWPYQSRAVYLAYFNKMQNAESTNAQQSLPFLMYINMYVCMCMFLPIYIHTYTYITLHYIALQLEKK